MAVQTYTRRWITCFFILALFLKAAAATAAVDSLPAKLTQDKPVVEVAALAEYLLDDGDRYSYDDILRGNLTFQRHTKSSFQFSFQKATLWIKCRITSAGTDNADVFARRSFLVFDNAVLGSVTLWVPVIRNGVSGVIRLSGGWQQKGKTDEYPFLCPTFLLPENIDDSRPVIIRVTTPYALQFRATLYSPDAFRQNSFILFLIIGFFMGILFAMILYNFVLYLFMRDRHYIYYILYVFFLLLWQCILFGLFRHFFPLLGNVLISYNPVSAALMMLFAVTFAIVFLNTSHTAPRHDKLLRALAAFMGVIILLVFLRQLWIANTLSYITGQVATVLLFTSAVSAVRTGFKPALYYLIAVGVFLTTAVIFIFKFYGLVPNNTFTMHIVIFGSATEAILLSFALGYRIRLFRDEEHAMRERERSLQAISITDELTGLFNRRFFNASLVKKVAATRRNDAPLSLLMMDVDHFKLYNDAYGHPEGDKVLVALGRLLTQVLREEDIACRYGGEEFVVILHNADIRVALDTAERIRSAFENLLFRPGTKNDIHVTLSIGVVELLPEENPDQLLSRADQNLYRAKQAGRNQISGA